MFTGISLFDSLTDAEKASLSLFCQERYLSANEILFREGDEATAMYIVKEGWLQAVQDRSDGVRVLGSIRPDGIVGEFALFDAANTAKVRTATVVATEPTVLLVIMNYSIADLALKHADVFAKITSIINARKAENMK